MIDSTYVLISFSLEKLSSPLLTVTGNFKSIYATIYTQLEQNLRHLLQIIVIVQSDEINLIELLSSKLSFHPPFQSHECQQNHHPLIRLIINTVFYKFIACHTFDYLNFIQE